MGSAQGQHRVAATKGKRVGQHGARWHTLAGRVRDIVQVALRVALLQMHGGHQHRMLHCHQRNQAFERASGPQQMAVHGLGGTHGYALSTAAKNGLEGLGLRQVIGLCASAVGVDGIHLRRNQASPMATAEDEQAVE